MDTIRRYAMLINGDWVDTGLGRELGPHALSRLGASQPSICELIRTDYSAAPAISAAGIPELWTGRCSVTMDSASEFDPLVAMAPVRTLGALYAVADITLPLGTPVRDYLAEAEVAEQPAFT